VNAAELPAKLRDRFGIFDRNVRGCFADADFCDVSYVTDPEPAFEVRLPLPSGQPGVLVVTYRIEDLPEPENPFEDVWVMENYQTGVWRDVRPDGKGEARVTM